MHTPPDVEGLTGHRFIMASGATHVIYATDVYAAVRLYINNVYTGTRDVHSVILMQPHDTFLGQLYTTDEEGNETFLGNIYRIPA